MISPNIDWDHSEDWFVTSFKTTTLETSAERKVTISLHDPEFGFISGHCIDGEKKKNLNFKIFNFT